MSGVNKGRENTARTMGQKTKQLEREVMEEFEREFICAEDKERYFCQDMTFKSIWQFIRKVLRKAYKLGEGENIKDLLDDDCL